MLVYILLGLGSVAAYITLAGFMVVGLPLVYNEQLWDGYARPGIKEMAWLWPLTLLAAGVYWILKIFAPAFWLGAFLFNGPSQIFERRKKAVKLAKARVVSR